MCGFSQPSPARLSPSEKATARQGAWYLKVKVQRPVSTSHSLAVLSEEPVSSVCESTAIAATCGCHCLCFCPTQGAPQSMLMHACPSSCLLLWQVRPLAGCTPKQLAGLCQTHSSAHLWSAGGR